MVGQRSRYFAAVLLMVAALVALHGEGMFNGSPCHAADSDMLAQSNAGLANSAESIRTYQRLDTYRQYLDRHLDSVDEAVGLLAPSVEILVLAEDYIATDMPVRIIQSASDLNSVGLPTWYTGSAITTEEKGYVEWVVDVLEAGFYNIEVLYHVLPGRSISVEREIRINGERLFSGADSLVFYRTWGDDGPVIVDTAGNEIRPSQVEKPMWQTVYLSDPLCYEAEPYKFYFNKGPNTITLISRAEPMAIAYLRLCQAERPRPYADVIAEHERNGYMPASDVFVKIQGEDAVYRSSPSLFAVFDQGDPTTEPYHHAQARLNSIGGHRWQTPGDWIAWEFEVPESGLYQIAIKGKQDLRRGIYSNRKILIDGEVPFAELHSVKFNYSSGYQMNRLGQDDLGEPYLIYLEEGKHELRMVASLGDLADLLRLTEEVLYELNNVYRSIIMITSSTPDPLRDYQLDKRVPGLIAKLGEQAQVIKDMAHTLEELTGQRGGHSAVLTDIAMMLQRMSDKPRSIPGMLGEFRDGVGNLGTWIMNTRNQPLQIDYIVVASPEQKMPRAEATVFERILHEIRAFFASFTHDYTGIRDISEIEESADTRQTDALKVWIGMGRDQAQVLKQMIEDSFTPETGIPVVLELVTAMQSLLVPATIAGTGPDVALGAANMDLAFRGAVVDLTQFEDFEEVTARFKKSAMTAFSFRDKVFALPEAQGFPMLFYRKDVLAELGLEVPNTWDDVYRMIPELKKRNLEFGIGKGIQTLEMFMYQKGVPLYKEDCIAVNLTSEAAIASFRQMTNLFRLYNCPLEYNFINRFRTGEMPLAIASYTSYNTLSVFAPEIRGLWGMAPVPGTVQEDGTINRAVPVHQDSLVGDIVPAGTTGSIIMANSNKKEQAWEFLKWWTRKDTQLRFGREMESLIGAAARYATANVEAMQELPWRAEEREQLNIQWDWVEGVPPVLGGYYVGRHFDWMFRAVVLHNEPLRETVIDYSREIDREITRKRMEFGYETDIEELDQKWKDLYWSHYTHLYRLDWEREEGDIYAEVLEDLGLDP